MVHVRGDPRSSVRGFARSRPAVDPTLRPRVPERGRGHGGMCVSSGLAASHGVMTRSPCCCRGGIYAVLRSSWPGARVRGNPPRPGAPRGFIGAIPAPGSPGGIGILEALRDPRRAAWNPTAGLAALRRGHRNHPGLRDRDAGRLPLGLRRPDAARTQRGADSRVADGLA